MYSDFSNISIPNVEAFCSMSRLDLQVLARAHKRRDGGLMNSIHSPKD